MKRLTIGCRQPAFRRSLVLDVRQQHPSMRTTLLLFCVCLVSVVMADPASPIHPLPAQQTLAQIAALPAKATLADLTKIVGTPDTDVGGAFHEYFFALDDGSSLRVRVHLSSDASIYSITHQSARGAETPLYPKPTPAD